MFLKESRNERSASFSHRTCWNETCFLLSFSLNKQTTSRFFSGVCALVSIITKSEDSLWGAVEGCLGCNPSFQLSVPKIISVMNVSEVPEQIGFPSVALQRPNKTTTQSHSPNSGIPGRSTTSRGQSSMHHNSSPKVPAFPGGLKEQRLQRAAFWENK